MVNKLITIIHEFPNDNPKYLLKNIQKLIKDAKIKYTEINNFQLHDIGLTYNNDCVRAILYFRENKEIFNQQKAQ